MKGIRWNPRKFPQNGFVAGFIFYQIQDPKGDGHISTFLFTTKQTNNFEYGEEVNL